MRYPRINVRVLQRRLQLFHELQRIRNVCATVNKENRAFHFHQVLAAVWFAFGEEADEDLVNLIKIVVSPIGNRLRDSGRYNAVGSRTLRS